jgi:tRNA-dihydrouridine synthase 3
MSDDPNESDNCSYDFPRARYLISVQSRPVPDDDAAEGATSYVKDNIREDTDNVPGAGTSGPSRKKLSREQKKTQRGANKGRRFGKIRDELELCWRIACGKPCEFGTE